MSLKTDFKTLLSFQKVTKTADQLILILAIFTAKFIFWFSVIASFSFFTGISDDSFTSVLLILNIVLLIYSLRLEVKYYSLFTIFILLAFGIPVTVSTYSDFRTFTDFLFAVVGGHSFITMMLDLIYVWFLAVKSKKEIKID